MSKWARKVDNNHKPIVMALRGCGIRVQDTSRFPGMLDLLAETRTGRLIRLEVKNGPNEPLTEAEQETFNMFPAHCYKVWEPQQALDICFDEDD